MALSTKNTDCRSAASARRASLCLVVFALLGAACGGPEAEVGPTGEQGLAAEIHENQGTTVLGTTPGALSVTKTGAFDADGNAISNIEVAQGGLSFTIGGVKYSGLAAAIKIDGARFVASDDSDLFVKRVCPHYSTPPEFQYNPQNPPKECGKPENGQWPKEPNAGEYEYAIMVKKGSAPLKPLCSDGWNRAMPIAGAWTEQGTHNTKSANFSFACNGSTAVKCTNWGYKPWVSAERHQACTRMAVADYCGNGNSHTLDGTLIGLWDNVASINPFGSEAAGFDFEAGWLPEGALCMRQKRWSIFPIGYCGNSMIDPRSSVTVDDGFCANDNVAEGRPGGDSDYLLFNESANYEAGLYTWTGNAGLYTTTSGFYGGVRATWTETPYSKQFASAEYEGIVFRDQLNDTIELRSCWLSQQGPFVTTTLACPPGSVASHHEGYVYPSWAPPTNLPPFLQNLVRPLTRYCFGENGQGACFTTTRPLSPEAAALATISVLEGHIIAYGAQ